VLLKHRVLEEADRLSGHIVIIELAGLVPAQGSP